jgi:hypothetical protein
VTKKGFFLRAETAYAMTERLGGVPGFWEADTAAMSHGETGMQPGEQAAADAEFCDWMRENLAHAAGCFGLRLTGPAVFGWRLRAFGDR